MNQDQIRNIKPSTLIPDENILVVKREILFQDGPWHGLKTEKMEQYLNIINKNKEFHPRSLMEIDQAYKQIIPYLVFTYQNNFFLMQRKSKSSEQRLKNKYSLGIGGHIRKEDLGSENIIDWSKREFEEEIDYQGTFSIEPVGILNDDSNDVGKVHLGFVFLLKGNSDKISVKSELKMGKLMKIDSCSEFYENMETWSQIVFSHLKNCPNK